MFESGESSFYQYESGIPEMKSIFYILKDCPGVYGARPSGAGYRGAVIGLIDPAYKEQIKAKIDEIYPLAIQNIKITMRLTFVRLQMVPI